jgi:extracellular factor (EF) 3-hydroxypalmitic acid methyl ester biosynthesis protein
VRARPSSSSRTAGSAIEALVTDTANRLRVFANAVAGMPPSQADSIYPDYAALVDEHLVQLRALALALPSDEHAAAAAYLRAQLAGVIHASVFLHRAVHKPWGYAGDAVMMGMLYDNAFDGRDAFECVAHYHPVQLPAAQAVRERAGMMVRQIRAMARDSPSIPLRVASIACGPAWELHELLATPDDAQRFHVSAFDQDPRALALAGRTTREIATALGRAPLVDRVRTSVRELLCEPDPVGRWGRFDFIYSMGLFDYLETPVAARLLRRLRGLLTETGTVCVGNFTNHPTRTCLDWWMDWPLIYRSPEELAALAAPATVLSLGSGPQLLLCLDAP